MHLASDCDGVELLVSNGAPFFVFVVEDQRNTCLCYPCLALFVDELLQIAYSNLQKRKQMNHDEYNNINPAIAGAHHLG